MFLEIVNFDKYNPRTDRKHHSWFRLENDFLNNESLFKLSAIEKFVWVCLLALRNQKNEQIFELDPEFLAFQLKVKKTVISSAIQKLIISKIIILHELVTTGNQLVSTGSPTNVRTNVTNVTNERSAEVENATSAPSAFQTHITEKLYCSWIELYQDDDWIKNELKKAQAWIHANPKRAPKRDFARFLNNWLSRGWEVYRKSIKGTGPSDNWLARKKAVSQKGDLSA